MAPSLGSQAARWWQLGKREGGPLVVSVGLLGWNLSSLRTVASPASFLSLRA
jgi:hypothetical protein